MSVNGIEQVIEDIGRRYTSDLRRLQDELRRFYAAQLAVKEQQIAELRRQVDAANAARDELARRVEETDCPNTRYLTDLRALHGEITRLGEEVGGRLASAEQTTAPIPTQEQDA